MYFVAYFADSIMAVLKEFPSGKLNTEEFDTCWLYDVAHGRATDENVVWTTASKNPFNSKEGELFPHIGYSLEGIFNIEKAVYKHVNSRTGICTLAVWKLPE